MHKTYLSHNAETMSVHHFPALWQTLTLSSMKQHLKTEEPGPIDTMLKAKTQKIGSLLRIFLYIDPGKTHFLYNCVILYY